MKTGAAGAASQSPPSPRVDQPRVKVVHNSWSWSPKSRPLSGAWTR